MNLVLIAAGIAAASASPPANAKFEGFDVDIVARPADIAADRFATELVEREGVVPWSGRITESNPTAKLGYRASWAGDNRHVIVYFNREEPAATRVCRLRGRTGGLSEARWQAIRWCASRLGVAMPARPPAPITVES